MAYLPHKNEFSLNELKEKFRETPKSIDDINKKFFNGKCPFFKEIDKNYQQEAQDFINIYKNLQNLALDIENILTKEIPFLKEKDKNKKYELTRKQVALIFLLSFFNLIEDPKKNKNRFNVYYVLFNNGFCTFQFGRCFLNYLTVIGRWLEQGKEDILNEKIIYLRDNIDQQDYLEKENIQLCELKLYEEGSLFDGDAEYCIDFANKYIGGGVLNGGNVQEEILFAIEPEAIVSMFFMEVMDKNDAIGIFNTIEYSKYSGYGNKFKFEKSAITDDLTKIKRHRIIAIDAINISSIYYIYKIRHQENIIRDIHKAYVGFNLINFDIGENVEKTIATGNWGCGCFGGNHELKFIQQWIAASFAGVKRLDYYSFKNKNMEKVAKYYNQIKDKYQTASSLYYTIAFTNIDENNIIKQLLQ